MTMKRKLVLALSFNAFLLSAQTDTLTLEQARQVALAYHPVADDKQLYVEAAALRASNVRSQWLPQVKATGQGTYQSEVTEFDLSPLGFPAITISPDQYRAGFEVRQNLLDMGMTQDQRELELKRGEVQAAQADVDLLKVSQRVDEIYGGILQQQAGLRILLSRRQEIAARQKQVASAVRNGVSLQSNEEVLRAEGLTTEQRIVEVRANLVALTQALGVLMGQPVDTSMTFVLPEPPSSPGGGLRPEYRAFQLQQEATGLQAGLIRHKNLPRLGLFADGYYGRPGFNFLNNEFRPYGIIGVGLNWNIAGFYTQKRELKVNIIEKQLVEDRRRQFEMQQRTDLEREIAEIDKLDQLVVLDEEIVRSKDLIVRSASSQLENGVITAQDYITYQNTRDLAMLDMELHRIRAVMARIDHQRTLGN